MLANKLLSLLLLSIFLQLTASYRILVFFPTPSFSHQRSQIAVSKALAAHGHQVTILSPDPFETNDPNIRQISLRFLYKDMGAVIQNLAVQNVKLRDIFEFMKHLQVSSMQEILSNEDVQKIISSKDEEFDAVITEFLGYVYTHAVADRFGATLIGMSTTEMLPWAHRSMGNPTHPIVHPFVFNHYPENPNIWERMQILYDDYDYKCMMREMNELLAPRMQQYFPENKASIEELLYNRVEFAIEFLSPAEGFVRPILPNTKQIGFIHVEKPKPLPKDLQEYLDNSKKGVIYLSFGSNVKSVNLGHDIMNILQKSLGSLPFDVLWKYENNSMPNKPENVRTAAWTPQTDLLAHPNIKLFITQGGFQSMEETISRHVPIVCIPFFGDQEHNAGHIEKLGIGKKVLKSELSVEKLKKVILEVIQNPKYKEKTIEIANLVRDTPMNATETAVWYIEHAIRNRGAEMFKHKGKTMPFHQYYFLDIAALFVTAFVVSLHVFVKICKTIYCKVFCSRKSGTKEKKKKQKKE